MEYWDEAATFLSKQDETLRRLIERHAGERLSGSGDAFSTLANAIVGQQISVAAASGIWKRFSQRFPGIFPTDIINSNLDDLRSCGLSMRKAEYLLGIARSFAGGELTDAEFDHWSDDEVRDRLCALRGVGPWTAEMFLIFHLRRPDILPLGDIGLHRAARRLYLWPEGESLDETRRRLTELAETWRPWRTVAVWYLWRDLDAEPVIY
ncbi:MAG: hypothetical protein WCT14_12435 [Treponemataceae bacterium]